MKYKHKLRESCRTLSLKIPAPCSLPSRRKQEDSHCCWSACLYKQQNPARILGFPPGASETCPDTPGPARSEAAKHKKHMRNWYEAEPCRSEPLNRSTAVFHVSFDLLWFSRWFLRIRASQPVHALSVFDLNNHTACPDGSCAAGEKQTHVWVVIHRLRTSHLERYHRADDAMWENNMNKHMD